MDRFGLVVINGNSALTITAHEEESVSRLAELAVGLTTGAVYYAPA